MQIRLFCSYSRKDEVLRQELENHLSMLKRGNLVTWHDGMLEPGSNWDDRIKQELDTAEIILLLVSPDFLASNYIYETEVARAIERHKAGTAYVIPVLLRFTDIEGLELFKWTGYPKGLKPVTQWRDRDEAFVDVVQGIRQAVNKLLSQAPSQSTPAPSATSITSQSLHSFTPESMTVSEKGKPGYQPEDLQQWEEDLGNEVLLETSLNSKTANLSPDWDNEAYVSLQLVQAILEQAELHRKSKYSHWYPQFKIKAQNFVSIGDNKARKEIIKPVDFLVEDYKRNIQFLVEVKSAKEKISDAARFQLKTYLQYSKIRFGMLVDPYSVEMFEWSTQQFIPRGKYDIKDPNSIQSVSNFLKTFLDSVADENDRNSHI
jgi:TIR domain/Type I restriction enzyme R protein N terminus (HSDR_N)